jgi:hypothetical protein
VGEVGVKRLGDWRRPALYQHWFLPMSLVASEAVVEV